MTAPADRAAGRSHAAAVLPRVPGPPPDPALVGLEAALDGDLIGDALQEHVAAGSGEQWGVSSCVPRYVRYKPGTSCLVQYDVTLREAGGAQTTSAPAHIVFYPEARARQVMGRRVLGRLDERSAALHGDLPIRRIALLAELGGVVQFFPVDRQVPTLVRAAARRGLGRILAAARGDEPVERLRCVRAELVRHKPGRKALLRYTLAAADYRFDLFAKLHSDGRLLAIGSASSALSTLGVATPRPWGYSSRLGALLYPEVTGRTMARLWGTDAYEAALGALVEQLARLRTLAPEELGPLPRLDLARAVAAAGQTVVTLLPALQPRITRLVGSLCAHLGAGAGGVSRGGRGASRGGARIVHGDFYDDQVLVSDGTVTLIDLDEVGVAHPLVDVGSFAARLGVRAASEGGDPSDGAGTAAGDDDGSGPVRSAAAAATRHRFLELCHAELAANDRHVAVFEAIALLRLAADPFRWLEPDWPARVEERVELVERRAAEAGVGRWSVWPATAGSLLDRGRGPRPGVGAGRGGLSGAQAGAGRQARSQADDQSPGAGLGPSPRVCRPLLCARNVCDPALPQLAQLQDAAAMAQLLTRAVYDAPVAVEQVSMVRHKPGRRCVIRYDVAVMAADGTHHERLFGKTFASQRGPRVHLVHKAAAAGAVFGPGIRVPESLAYLPGLRLVLQRGLAGDPCAPALLAGDTQLAVQLAKALHRLHTSELELHRTHSLDDETGPLAERVAQLTGACPELEPWASKCLGLVRRSGRGIETWRWRPIHRDFYHDQILVGQSGPAILDLDDAAMSEPAIDVANFGAHLRLLGLQKRDDARALDDVAAAFLDEYTHLDRQLNESLVTFLEAATLLRLAHIHLRRERGVWLADSLMRECARMLLGSDGASGTLSGPLLAGR